MPSGLPNVINGRPFAPSVRALMERFGNISRGTEIRHEAMLAAIGERELNGRYRSVFQAFRRRLLDETGIYLKSLPKVGYLAVDAPTQLAVSTSKWRQHAKGIKRATDIAARAPDAELSESARRENEHILQLGMHFRREIAASVSAINLRLGPPETMPKPVRKT